MQYILQEDPDSRLHKFLQLQFKNPTRGDWASSCLQDLEYLEITISLEEIRTLNNFQFSKILKDAILPKALEYLVNKVRSKGKEIEYTEMKMAEYLMPNLEKISIDDRRKIFQLRNRMLPIEANFPSKNSEKRCWCGEKEDSKHIYICKKWKGENEQIPYEMIYTDHLPTLVQVYKQFEINFKRREEYESKYQTEKENKPHVIPQRDPLFSFEHSYGNKH